MRLTGIAAGFGVLMNLNYLLAGTVSINPVLGMLGLFLVLAWRVAGLIGLDRWLLPILGLPLETRIDLPTGLSRRARSMHVAVEMKQSVAGLVKRDQRLCHPPLGQSSSRCA